MWTSSLGVYFQINGESLSPDVIQRCLIIPWDYASITGHDSLSAVGCGAGGLQRISKSSGMHVNIPAAVLLVSLTGGRIPLCFTCPKTLNAFKRLFFVLASLLVGLYFVQGSEPQFGEGFLQTALTIVLSSCIFGFSPLLTTKSDTAFFLLCFMYSCIEYLLYRGHNSTWVILRLFHLM